MTSPNVNVKIGGDPAGAVAAAKTAQAAIDSLHGRSIDVDINIKNNGAAMAAMVGVAGAADGAADSVRGFSDTVRQGLRDMGDLGRSAGGDGFRRMSSDTDRASDSVRNLGASSSSIRQLGTDTDRASRSFGELESGASRADRYMVGAGGSAERVGSALVPLGAAARGSALELKDFGDGIFRAGSEGGSAARTIGSFGRILGEAGEAGAGFSSRIGPAIGQMTSMAGGIGGIGGIAMGAGLATAGIGILAGATGALGVVGAGAMGGIGAGLGLAGAGMAAFAWDSLKDTAKFGAAFKGIESQFNGYKATVSEPFGDSMVRMAAQADKSSAAITGPLRSAFAGVGQTAERNLPSILAAGAALATGIRETAGLSAPAADAFFKNAPALAGAAVAPMEQVAKTFSQVSAAAWSEGIPAFKGLMSAAGDFGSEVVKIGAANMGPALDVMSSLTRGATGMAQDLEPAIRPSMSAFSALGNAVMGAIGDSSPAIERFSNQVTASSPGIQAGLEGVVRAAAGVGDVVVGALGVAGPMLQEVGKAAEGIGTGLGPVMDFMTAGTAMPAIDSALDVRRNTKGGVSSIAGIPTGIDMLSGDTAIPALDRAMGTQRGEPGFLGARLPTGFSGPGNDSAAAQAAQAWTSEMGHRPGGMPGQYSGISVGWTDTDNIPGGEQPAISAADDKRMQQLENSINSPGTSKADANRMKQAQRNVARANAPESNVWAGTGGKPPSGSQGLPPADADATKPGGGQAGAWDDHGRQAPHQEQATKQGFQGPGSEVQRHVGSSMGLSGGGNAAAQLSQLSQAQTQATASTNALAAAGQNMGPTLQSSMQQAGGAGVQASQQFQGGMQAMQQHAQQLPGQVGSTMSMLGPALSQPMSQMAPLAAQAMQQVAPAAAQAIQPAPIQQAMSGAVSSAASSAAPAAASSGSDLGASIPSGMGQGITKDVEKVVTIVEHLVMRVIQAGAGGLDAHSPSRVFAKLGESIPQGLALGVTNEAGVAVSATQKLIGQITTSAGQQMGGQQQSGLQSALQQQTQAQTQAAQRAQQDAQQAQQAQQGSMFSSPQAFLERISPMAAGARYAQQQQDEVRRAVQTGDTSRLSPEQRNQIEQQKQASGLYQYESGFLGNEARHKTLTDTRGFSEATAERVQRNEADHEVRRGEILGRRDKNHEKAVQLAGTEGSAAAQLKREGRSSGKDFSKGVAEGVDGGKGEVGDSADGVANEAKGRLRKNWKINSPSQVAHDMGSDFTAGAASGIGAAIGAATSGIQGVASDRGLEVGYKYARSMLTGMQSVYKSSDFQASSFPQVDNERAKTALGILGALGPAGAGAQIWKTPMVTMGGGSSATPVIITINHRSELDGQALDQKVTTISGQVVDGRFEALATSIGMQAG